MQCIKTVFILIKKNQIVGLCYIWCSCVVMASGGRSPCIELVLEGERLCKVGNYAGGVQYFEQAIQLGTGK